MTLDQLTPGQDALIGAISCEGTLRKHILEMGLTPGTEVTLIKYAPMGDPLELRVRGYELTLRRADAAKIEVSGVHDAHEVKRKNVRIPTIAHPRMGEGTHKTGSVIPEGEKIRFALAGNQNCGKTTLFNQLTGASQHVGNFPGVTVEQRDGLIRRHPEAVVTDLPGIYSLTPYSGEEIVTRDFLLNTKPHGIINIIDATSIERNLYLTLQILELGIPTVLALNMMDEMRGSGGTVLVSELEALLGVPVVPISAAKNEGIDELIEHAIHVARYGEIPERTDFCAEGDHGAGAVHRAIHAVTHLIEDHARRAELPVRFAATKLIEGDDSIVGRLALTENETATLAHIIRQMEAESGTDRIAAIADMRFTFIGGVCGRTVKKPHASRERIRSEKIDRVLTGRFTAIPAFIAIMAAVFYLTFSLIGQRLSDWMEAGIGALTDLADGWLASLNVNPVVHSLIIDGIFAGVGGVLVFLPIIIVLFFFLSILEDSGYMARVAFVMDTILRRIGLSGRSFVPMLVGFGCSVPAIMATRTLPSERDRKMTILLTPFMSCSAKLPIYSLFAAAFFAEHKAAVMISLYLLGIAVGVLTALCLKSTAFRGEPVPFVMELPNYRMPGAKNVLRLIWEKAKDFLTRAFTVIFLATVIIWFLQSFDIRFNLVEDSGDSMLAMLGSVLSPLFAPLGFGDWRISTALITGFTAKESVVSTLTVLLGGSTEALPTFFTPLTAFVFLVFSLLYTPCVAAIAAVRREMGTKASVGVAVLQCAIAWAAALAVRLIGLALGL